MGPIGVFDSGYGGLTILKEFRKLLPEYDFLYLGDNARAPYGTRSFEIVYEFTQEAVEYLFNEGCELIILACNTASAKALRNIQQQFLPTIGDKKRVLGVIRPSAEVIGNFSPSNKVGILATQGTVKSNSYHLEIKKFFPKVDVYQQECPLWVTLIEENKHETEAGKAFIKEDVERLLQQDDKIDTILLGCTHYPIVQEYIKTIVPKHVQVVSQGEIVAKSLVDYLKRHPWMDKQCRKGGDVQFLTTENPEIFDQHASLFFEENIASKHIHL